MHTEQVQARLESVSHLHLWVAVILVFGITDIATTLVGIYGYVPERHFAYTHMIQLFESLREYGFFVQVLATLSVWKITAIGVLYVVYRVTPESYRVGVPIGALALGSIVVLWNTLTILRAVVIEAGLL